jgi:hypothetical protein
MVSPEVCYLCHGDMLTSPAKPTNFLNASYMQEGVIMRPIRNPRWRGLMPF